MHCYRYEDYDFISNIGTVRLAAKGWSKPQGSLIGLLGDLYFLSHSDYLVCTFSSNVGVHLHTSYRLPPRSFEIRMSICKRAEVRQMEN